MKGVFIKMVIILGIILVALLILPFSIHAVERNVEIFLLVMGFITATTSGVLSGHLFIDIFGEPLIYLITLSVLGFGLIFKKLSKHIKRFIEFLFVFIPLKIFVFLIIFVLGMLSSIITSIVAAILLVEIVHVLPFSHKNKTILTVLACFAIGLGSILTPLGGPLSTIIVDVLKSDFTYLAREFWIYIIPVIFAIGIFGGFYIEHRHKKHEYVDQHTEEERLEEQNIVQTERLSDVFIRASKIFVFIVAVELLGAGFKPVVTEYILGMHKNVLYWINTASAVLDNATMAAAEMEPNMSTSQIHAVVIGLLISGGIFIPGNVPNIIAAGKLNIKPREWAIIGVPTGLLLLVIFFFII
jgi:predicted cation transporter